MSERTTSASGVANAGTSAAFVTALRTKPFVILGMNAITLYVVSGLLAETLGLITVTASSGREMSLGRYFFVEFLAPIASPKNASLMYAFANLLVLFALLAWMYRRKIFLRV